MRTLSRNQAELLAAVQAAPGANTHRLNRSLGNRQPYETTLRNRLFALERRGHVREERREGAHGWVTARRWYPTGRNPSGMGALLAWGMGALLAWGWWEQRGR